MLPTFNYRFVSNRSNVLKKKEIVSISLWKSQYISVLWILTKCTRLWVFEYYYFYLILFGLLFVPYNIYYSTKSMFWLCRTCYGTLREHQHFRRLCPRISKIRRRWVLLLDSFQSVRPKITDRSPLLCPENIIVMPMDYGRSIKMQFFIEPTCWIVGFFLFFAWALAKFTWLYFIIPATHAFK